MTARSRWAMTSHGRSTVSTGMRLLLAFRTAVLLFVAAAPRLVGAQREAVDRTTGLSPREQVNAEAVTRLLGIVRFFHPSDEAAALDWDPATVATMRAALDAADDEELARCLTSALASIAPTVVLSRGQNRTVETIAAPV